MSSAAAFSRPAPSARTDARAGRRSCGRGSWRAVPGGESVADGVEADDRVHSAHALVQRDGGAGAVVGGARRSAVGARAPAIRPARRPKAACLGLVSAALAKHGASTRIGGVEGAVPITTERARRSGRLRARRGIEFASPLKSVTTRARGEHALRVARNSSVLTVCSMSICAAAMTSCRALHVAGDLHVGRARAQAGQRQRRQQQHEHDRDDQRRARLPGLPSSARPAPAAGDVVEPEGGGRKRHLKRSGQVTPAWPGPRSKRSASCRRSTRAPCSASAGACGRRRRCSSWPPGRPCRCRYASLPASRRHWCRRRTRIARSRRLRRATPRGRRCRPPPSASACGCRPRGRTRCSWRRSRRERSTAADRGKVGDVAGRGAQREQRQSFVTRSGTVSLMHWDACTYTHRDHLRRRDVAGTGSTDGEHVGAGNTVAAGAVERDDRRARSSRPASGPGGAHGARAASRAA